jgi:hypothetical protein
MPFSEDLLHTAQELSTIADHEIKQLEEQLKKVRPVHELVTALTEYVQSGKPFDEELTHAAAKLPAIIEKEITDLEDRLKFVKPVRKLAIALTLYVQGGKPFHILELQAKESKLLQQIQDSQHPTYAKIQAILQAAAQEAKVLEPFSVKFPRLFPEACQKEGLLIDQDSRHPIYTFDNKFFEVKLDEAKKTICISNYEAGKLDDVPADISVVIEILQRERKRVFDKAEDSLTFLKLLRREYLKVISAAHKKDGDSVPIRPIIRTLCNNKKVDHYRPDEFVVALSQLLKEGQTQIDGLELDLQQTKDTEEGVRPITEASRGYVGFLLFKKIDV